MKIKDLFNFYIKARSMDDRDDLGWTSWFLETKPAGQAHWVDTTLYIDKVFAIQILREIAPMTEETVRGQVIDLCREVKYLIDGPESPLRKAIADVAKPEAHFTAFVPPDALTKLGALSALFDATVQRLSELEAAEVRAALVSEKKVEELRQEAIEQLRKTSTLMALAKSANILISPAVAPEGVVPFNLGYNTVVNKEAFIENSPVHYVDFGEQYGRGIAQGFDLKVLEALESKIPKWSKEAEGIVDLCTQLRAASLNLISRGQPNQCVITTINFDMFMTHIPEFRPKWHRDCKPGPEKNIPGFIGLFQFDDLRPIPAYRASVAAAKKMVLLIEFHSVGQIVQVSPANDAAEGSFVRDGLFVKVTDLNRDAVARQEIVASNQKWITEHADPDAYLKNQALLQIRIRTAFCFDAALKSGFKITLNAAKPLDELE